MSDRQTEWPGQTSAKFTTNKAHTGPFPRQESERHPLYSVNNRKHFAEKLSDSWQYRPH